METKTLHNFARSVLSGKNKYLLAGFIIVALTLFAFLPAIANELNVVNLGFEGAKVVCYGSAFTNSANPTKVYAIGSTPVGATLTTSTQKAAGSSIPMAVSWDSATNPTQQDIMGFGHWYGSQMLTLNMPNLNTVVESNIPLEAVSATGQPLPQNLISGTSSDNQAQQLDYWNIQATTNSAGQITGYKVTQKSVLLVQADFALNVWLQPKQGNHITASGWDEGKWDNVELWYEVMWNQWENSLGSTINGANPQAALQQLQNSGGNGTLSSVSPFQFGGGVPITAWIQSIAMPVNGGNGVTYDLYSAASSSSSSTTKALDNLGITDQVKNNIIAAADGLSPNQKGQFLTLYTQPSDLYQYSTAYTGKTDPQNLASGQVPSSSTQYPNEYFKIGVNGFGTYASASGGFLGLGQDWTVYYPAVAYDVHLVFAIYGTHTYLWTTQTAQKNNYPGFTNETTQITTTYGALHDIGSWLNSVFSNPLYMLIILGIIIIVIAAILIVFFPEAIKIINGGLKAGRKGAKGAAKRMKSTRKKSRKNG